MKERKEHGGRAREGRPGACRPGRSHSGATPQAVAGEEEERGAVSGNLIKRGGEGAPPPSANTHTRTQGRFVVAASSPFAIFRDEPSSTPPLEGRDRIREKEGRRPRRKEKKKKREGLRSGRSLVCQWPKTRCPASLCAAESCTVAPSGCAPIFFTRRRGGERVIPFRPPTGFSREVFFFTTRRLRLFLICSK